MSFTHPKIANWRRRSSRVAAESSPNCPSGRRPLRRISPPATGSSRVSRLGVVIVEAAEKSGSLITARMALEQDRQVFAVPGSPLTGRTRGSNRLLKEGARLVDCVEDVLEELAPQLGLAAASRLDTDQGSPSSGALAPATVESEPDEAKVILNQLKGAEKLHVDSIIEGTGLNAQTVLKLLLELELGGLVTQHPGKLFTLNQ